MRDYSKLPLLTPWEAYERAQEDGTPECPVFGVEYRVRNAEAWKVIETLLRQDDVRRIIVASFGLRRFADSLDTINMLRARGWETKQVEARVTLNGDRYDAAALQASHDGK